MSAWIHKTDLLIMNFYDVTQGHLFNSNKITNKIMVHQMKCNPHSVLLVSFYTRYSIVLTWWKYVFANIKCKQNELLLKKLLTKKQSKRYTLKNSIIKHLLKWKFMHNQQYFIPLWMCNHNYIAEINVLNFSYRPSTSSGRQITEDINLWTT